MSFVNAFDYRKEIFFISLLVFFGGLLVQSDDEALSEAWFGKRYCSAPEEIPHGSWCESLAVERQLQRRELEPLLS